MKILPMGAASPYEALAAWKDIIPVAGHVRGLFMGQVIKRNGLEEKMRQRIPNPFAFFTCIIGLLNMIRSIRLASLQKRCRS